MDDKDRFDPQNSDPEDDIDTWPAGLLANHGTGADTGSSNAGALAGGVVGAAQAGHIMRAQETEEERSAPVPASPDVYGYEHHATGDDGVSAPQREVEADELNG
jgi:hypothetical protein